MADSKISQLTSFSGTLLGTEVLPIVVSGGADTNKITLNQLYTDLAVITAPLSADIIQIYQDSSSVVKKITYGNLISNLLPTTLTDGNIFVGNASNIASSVVVSGDITISNTGVVTLANTAVTPGSYTYGNFTVDSKGRITAASSGSVSTFVTATAGTFVGDNRLIRSDGLVSRNTQASVAILSDTGALSGITNYSGQTFSLTVDQALATGSGFYYTDFIQNGFTTVGNVTGTDASNLFNGVYWKGAHNFTKPSGGYGLSGIFGFLWQQNAGLIDGGQAISGVVLNNSGRTITECASVRAFISNAGTITTGSFFAGEWNSYIGAGSYGTLNGYYLKSGAISSATATTKYALNFEDTSPSKMAGPLRVQDVEITQTGFTNLITTTTGDLLIGSSNSYMELLGDVYLDGGLAVLDQVTATYIETTQTRDLTGAAGGSQVHNSFLNTNNATSNTTIGSNIGLSVLNQWSSDYNLTTGVDGVVGIYATVQNNADPGDVTTLNAITANTVLQNTSNVTDLASGFRSFVQGVANATKFAHFTGTDTYFAGTITDEYGVYFPSGSLINGSDNYGLFFEDNVKHRVAGDFKISLGKTNAVYATPITTSTIQYTPVGNVGTGEDNLMTSTLAAYAFDVGVAVRIKAWGYTANNANSKTLKIYFGSQVQSVSLTVSQDNEWQFETDIVGTGSNTQKFKSLFMQDGTVEQHIQLRGSMTEDTTNTITIKVTGEGVSNNDIVQEGFEITVLRV